MTTPLPTQQTYTELQQAYSQFNRALFQDALPPCLITLQRHKKTLGYFSPERFVNRSGTRTDEIALNPAYFATRSIKEVLSTLVHEMCHGWQQHFGKPGRGRYHNKEWGQKMESMGLLPTDTGKPGGKTTGDKITHCIVPGGTFEQVADQLLTQTYCISWVDRFADAPADKISVEGVDSDELATMGIQLGGTDQMTNNSNRAKYSHICSDRKPVSVWGKPGLELACVTCGCAYERH